MDGKQIVSHMTNIYTWHMFADGCSSALLPSSASSSVCVWTLFKQENIDKEINISRNENKHIAIKLSFMFT
jgi:hypothetical protein